MLLPRLIEGEDSGRRSSKSSASVLIDSSRSAASVTSVNGVSNDVPPEHGPLKQGGAVDGAARNDDSSHDGDNALLCVSTLERVHAYSNGRGVDALLRGAPLWQVMSRGAVVFSSCDGSAEDYERSQPTDSVDYFVSHVWAASRIAKYFALVYTFTLSPALCVGFVAAAIGCALTVLGALPAVGDTGISDLPRADGNSMYPLAPWSGVFGVCALVLAPAGISSASRLAAWLRLVRPRLLFVDRLCIHQTDHNKRRAGIEALGGFLNVSRRMLILWSPGYFHRLWCCLEVAAFLRALDRRRGIERSLSQLQLDVSDGSLTPPLRFAERDADHAVRIVPLALVRFIFCGGVVGLACGSIGFLELVPRMYFLLGYGLVAATIGIPLLLTIPSMRQLSHERARLEQHLRSFRVADADCSEPADRALILALIGAWYAPHALAPRVAGLSSPEVPSVRPAALAGGAVDVGVATFERYVQSTLRRYVRSQVGSSTAAFSFRTCLPAIACNAIVFLDYVAQRALVPQHVWGGAAPKAVGMFSYMLYGISVCFGVTPMGFAMLVKLSNAIPRQPTYARELAVGFVAQALAVAPPALLYVAVRHVYYDVPQLPPGVDGLCCVALTAVALTVTFWRSLRAAIDRAMGRTADPMAPGPNSQAGSRQASILPQAALPSVTVDAFPTTPSAAVCDTLAASSPTRTLSVPSSPPNPPSRNSSASAAGSARSTHVLSSPSPWRSSGPGDSAWDRSDC